MFLHKSSILHERIALASYQVFLSKPSPLEAFLEYKGRKIMKIQTFLLLALYAGLSQATVFPLLPRVGCFARFALFRFDITNYDKYATKYFRDDSAMSLWQTGRYVGAEAIEEYVKFVTPLNPLWSSNQQLDSKVKFAGFDRKANQCKFLVFYHYNYVVDESSGRSGIDYTVTNMVKLYFNPRKRYIPKIDVYYTDDYVNVLFGFLFDTEEMRAFICNVYEGDTCSGILEPPDDCMAQLSSLDKTSADGRVDGNTIGCRMLHSVLAETRDIHCPHISFEPMEDFQGEIKCQTEGTVTALDLFDQADIDALAEYTVERGLDPVKGHDFVQDNRLLA